MIVIVSLKKNSGILPMLNIMLHLLCTFEKGLENVSTQFAF